MGIFNIKQTTEKIFSKHFNRISNLIKTSCYGFSSDELLYALYIIVDFAAASFNKNRQKIVNDVINWYNYNVRALNFDELDERISLYGAILRGEIKLRGDWLKSKINTSIANPIFIVCTAYGDIVTNPKCKENYLASGLCINNIFEEMIFSTQIMPNVLNEMTELYNDIYFL